MQPGWSSAAAISTMRRIRQAIGVSPGRAGFQSSIHLAIVVPAAEITESRFATTSCQIGKNTLGAATGGNGGGSVGL
jgi:hypothetical protein